MKKKTLGLTIAISTVIVAAFPNTAKKIAFRKTERVKYQAVKLENSMDAMLNPEQGGVNPMPPPPPWIPPVEEGINDKMPPAYIPKKRGSGNYTPMRHLPPSAPWMTPSIKDKSQLRNTPAYPIR